MKTNTKLPKILILVSLILSAIFAIFSCILFITKYDINVGAFDFLPKTLFGTFAFLVGVAALLPAFFASKIKQAREIAKTPLSLGIVSMVGGLLFCASGVIKLGGFSEFIEQLVLTFSPTKVAVKLFSFKLNIYSFGASTPVVLAVFGTLFALALTVYYILDAFEKKVKFLPAVGILSLFFLIFNIYFTRNRAMNDPIRNITMVIPALALISILFELKQNYKSCSRYSSAASFGSAIVIIATGLSVVVLYLYCLISGREGEFVPSASEVFLILASMIIAFRRIFSLPAKEEAESDTIEDEIPADEMDFIKSDVEITENDEEIIENDEEIVENTENEIAETDEIVSENNNEN